MQDAPLTLGDLARIVTEAERALAMAQGDPRPPLPWDTAPAWQRQQTGREIGDALSGETPAQTHDSWVRQRRREGWTRGDELDAIEKTDPRVVSFEHLPAAHVQRALLRHAIVIELTPWLV